MVLRLLINFSDRGFPMRRRYIIASVVGVAFGLFALFFVANSELFFYHSSRLLSWEGYENLKPGPLLDLQHKAIFLRMCSGFVDQGFLFTVVPAFVACGLVKLEQMAKTNKVLDFLSLGVKVTLIVCLISMAVGLAFGLVAGLDPTHPRDLPYFEVMFFQLLGCSGLFFLLCVLFVVVPMWSIGIIVFLLVGAFPPLAQWSKRIFAKPGVLPK